MPCLYYHGQPVNAKHSWLGNWHGRLFQPKFSQWCYSRDNIINKCYLFSSVFLERWRELNNIFKVYLSKNETEKYRQKFSTKQKLLRGYHSGASNSVRNSVNMLLSIVMTMGNLVSLSFTAVCRTSKSPTGIVERSVVA